MFFTAAFFKTGTFTQKRLSMLYTTPTTLTLFGRWKEKKILLEAKGRFWDSAEYSKYVWISQALPDDYELVFLFSDPNAPMPQANLRKDGTKRTHGEWASSKGFRWYSEMSIPNEWVKKEYKEEGL
jgi:hypothetical protein